MLQEEDKWSQCYELEYSLDLGMSLYPSFLLPLFRVRGSILEKVHGYAAGTRMRIKGSYACCEGPGCSREVLRYWLGQWLHVEKVLDSMKGATRKFLEAYRELGLLASPWDREAILVTVFLSRNTSYHSNVIRWAKTIFSASLGEDGRLDPLDAKRVAQKTSSSYQVKQLIEVIDQLVEAIRHVDDPWITRRRLLEIPFVGPKVADAVLLHSGYGGWFTPVDIHYHRISERLKILPQGLRRPDKNKCLEARADCRKCPYRLRCIAGQSISIYGEASGLIQTAAYIHDSLRCSKGDCVNCSLGQLCKYKVVKGVRV